MFVNRVDWSLPKENSPTMLYDRLLTLAQDAEQAGYDVVAEHLYFLALGIVNGSAEHG